MKTGIKVRDCPKCGGYGEYCYTIEKPLPIVPITELLPTESSIEVRRTKCEKCNGSGQFWREWRFF